MLILFDIDMTLLETDHIGIGLLENAGRELFRDDFTAEGVDFGGALDPVIIAEMLQRNRIEPHPENIRAMRQRYHEALRNAADRQPIARPLPGAHELVHATRAHEHIDAIGVLTGNFPETGAIKLASAGFDTAHFEINAWGDASPHPSPRRAHLPPVAMERFRDRHDRPLDPRQVVIIGDTVHDVTCAIDNQCRVLAVATGHATRRELEDAGAHRVVDDLSQTEDLLDWITATHPARR